MEISIKTVKLSMIKVNPDNPRQINRTDLERLVKSLRDFPEMMQLREIVVDENMVILGGNMRYRALKQIGEKECVAKIVKGLTPEQKKEFIVKDNSTFGEWDMDLLSGWDDLPLVDWGVEIPKHWNELSKEDSNDMVPNKDPNILVRISFHPGIWLGKRDEIMTIMEKLKKTYDCSIKVEE